MRPVLLAVLLAPALAMAQPGATPAVEPAAAPTPTSAEVLSLARGAHAAGTRGDCVGARTLAARIQRLDPDFHAAVVSTDLSITQCKPRPRVYAVEPLPPAAPAPLVSRRGAPARVYPVDRGRNAGGQLFLGGAMGAGLAFLGGIVAFSSESGDEGSALLLVSLGLVTGTTAGVVLAGDNEATDYSLGLTLAGSVAGTLIGWQLALGSEGMSPAGAVLVLVGTPTLGAMLGFNASRRSLYPQATTRLAPPAPRISDPAATVTLLGGSF